MKYLKLFIATIALVFTANIASANEEPVKPSAQLRSELVDLIGNNHAFELESEEPTVEVIFTVNPAGEVIVISVLSDHLEAERHVKNKINYKKVSHRVSKPGEMYLMPVKFTKS
jgi:hypothetical protein